MGFDDLEDPEDSCLSREENLQIALKTQDLLYPSDSDDSMLKA